jgi:hypothetical protein
MAEQLAAAESSVTFQLCDELACRHAVMLGLLLNARDKLTDRNS